MTRISNHILAVVFSIIAVHYSAINAQEFKAHSIDLNMQLGLSPTYTSAATGIPPLSVSVDYGLPVEDAGPGVISLGAFLGASTSRIDFPRGHIKYSHYVVAARSTYHYVLSNHIDTYAGLLLGARIIDYEQEGSITDYENTNTRPIFSVFAGAKYYVIDNMAIMAELGYGYTWLNLGVCIRMK